VNGAIFYNRRSGTFTPEKLELIESFAKDAALQVEEIGNATDLMERIRWYVEAGARLVIVGGGDGSIHYSLQALAGTQTRLGILPLGTFNHLAKDLGISLDCREALETAVRGTTREIDLGRVNGRYFANNMIIGLYPDIVRERERLRRWYGKWRAYVRAGLLAFHRFRHVSLLIETAHHLETVKTHVFAVAVNEYDLSRLGILAPKATFDRGRLSVYWLPHMSKPAFIRTIARYLGGRLRSGEQFRFVSTSAVTVRSRHRMIRVGIDGEYVTFDTPLRIAIVPRGLLVRVPKKAPGQQ
jgi:diacylglycerol kinase family enzyme